MFIQWFMESELETNIAVVGKMERKYRVLSPSEKDMFLKRYDKNESRIPFIAYDDPIARYYGMQRGDVLECKRASETAGRYSRYQICRFVEEVPKASAVKRQKK